MNLLKVAHLNIRSLLPKFNDLANYISSNNFDVIALGETWLNNFVEDQVIAIPGYNLLRKDRTSRGGGVCMYIKNKFNYKICYSNNNIEQLWISVDLRKTIMHIGVVYKAPNVPYKMFIDELEESLSYHTSLADQLVCVGDINIDMLKTDSVPTLYFNQMVEALNLLQVVNEPTRVTSSSYKLIDIILISDQNLLKKVEVCDKSDLSDHDLIYCFIEVNETRTATSFKTFRDFQNLNYDLFDMDLKGANLDYIFHCDSVNEKVVYLNNAILNVFDLHAPYVRKKVLKKRAPWLTDNVRLLMSLRDKAKKRFKRTKLPAHWNYYKNLRNFTTLSIKNEKTAYFSYITRNSNSKTLWSELKSLNITKNKSFTLTSELDDPNFINNYFINNIPTCAIDNNLLEYYSNNKLINAVRFSFHTVDEECVSKLVYHLRSTSYGADNINLRMLLLCCPFILPFITHIINSCITSNIFPSCWKKALVTPLPKVADPKCFSDLRPISILPTLSKIMEKVMEIQIKEYLNNYNILPSTQSGFRKGYSCTTALLSVTDDIIKAYDTGMLSVLVLLDYSKAFDTISHSLLLSLLHFIGFDTHSVELIKNYLCGRSQVVKVNGSISDECMVKRGVPQGSILGPLLFSIYTSQIIKNVEVCQYHMYADDTQLYHSFQFKNSLVAVKNINEDLNKLLIASTNHALLLNPSKSVMLVFGNKNDCIRFKDTAEVLIDGVRIPLVEQAKYLGLTVDRSLRFRAHVLNNIKKAYMNLKLIYPHRTFLSRQTKIMLCESLVLSQFLFGFEVYFPCIDSDTSRRIQRVQNSCIRFICGIRKFQHISHKFSELGWLNMTNRFKLRAACLFHKIIQTKTPPYLLNKIKFRTDVHNINLRNVMLITPPLHKTACFERSFTFVLHKIYNSVPHHMIDLNYNSFKNQFSKLLYCKQCEKIDCV
jgi:exonuclease III